jgi:FtsH-binding integral membrane protein
MESLPSYISWTFILTTFLTIGFFLLAARQARFDKRFLIILSIVFAFFLAVHAALASNGFFLIINTLPPRFILAPVPTIVALILLLLVFARKPIPVSALQTLMLLHVVRVPVELVLLMLFQNGLVPQLMTFEGRNFDILSGLTAPFVAWLATRGGKVNKPLLVVWNLLALGLLINIVVCAILSLPTPFQQLGFEQPNRAVLYFPFIWLPAIVVPTVFVAHLLSLWQLAKINR